MMVRMRILLGCKTENLLINSFLYLSMKFKIVSDFSWLVLPDKRTKIIPWFGFFNLMVSSPKSLSKVISGAAFSNASAKTSSSDIPGEI